MPRYCIRTGMIPLHRIPRRNLYFVRSFATLNCRNRTLIRQGW